MSPGDSVHLTIDAARLGEPDFAWLNIGGDKALLSTQLNRCVNYLYNLPSRSINLNLPPEDMLTAVKQDYHTYTQTFGSYAARNNIDPLVQDWVRLDMKFLISNQIVDYGQSQFSAGPGQDAFLKVYSDPSAMMPRNCSWEIISCWDTLHIS